MDIPNIIIQVGGVDLEFKVRTSNFLEPDDDRLNLDIEVILLNPDGSESEVRAGTSVLARDSECVALEICRLASDLAQGLYTRFHVGVKPYYYFG